VKLIQTLIMPEMTKARRCSEINIKAGLFLKILIDVLSKSEKVDFF
jgi:uncharacterized membrane protein